MNKIIVIDKSGRPLGGVPVKVYRSQRYQLEDRLVRGVPAEANPYLVGKTGRRGRCELGPDPLGKASPRETRSFWLFVIASTPEKDYYRYVTLLDFNLAYWRGKKKRATFRFNLD